MLNKDEQQLLDKLNLIHLKIMYEWNLGANNTDFIGAIHVIQHFIIQHMLARKSPEEFNSWYNHD